MSVDLTWLVSQTDRTLMFHLCRTVGILGRVLCLSVAQEVWDMGNHTQSHSVITIKYKGTLDIAVEMSRVACSVVEN